MMTNKQITLTPEEIDQISRVAMSEAINDDESIDWQKAFILLEHLIRNPWQVPVRH